MSYYNPKIFNKQNLKAEDRQELDFWNGEFLNCVEFSKDEYELRNCDDIPLIEELKKQIIDDFCVFLKTQWGYTLQENVVSIIDNYEEDVEEIENPETYFYEGEENGDSEESQSDNDE